MNFIMCIHPPQNCCTAAVFPLTLVLARLPPLADMYSSSSRDAEAVHGADLSLLNTFDFSAIEEMDPLDAP
jgi:hypothetical protein